MKIKITAREASDKYDWNEFCKIVGLDYYCLNEGMDGDTDFYLTVDEAIRIGIRISDQGIQ